MALQTSSVLAGRLGLGCNSSKSRGVGSILGVARYLGSRKLAPSYLRFAGVSICQRGVHFEQSRQISTGSTCKMRIVQFRVGESERLGVETGVSGDIFDLNADGTFPYTRTLDLLQGGQDALDLIKRTMAGKTAPVIPRDRVTLQAPISGPDKVLCVGLNYRDHCEEQRVPLPVEPLFFNKFPSNIIGPMDSIEYPEMTNALDWEVELAIVIGKKGKNIKLSEARSHVFGYTVAHDVSARDWQMHKNGGQWLLGKAMDDFCPLGPSIVTMDDLGDPHHLRLQCRVNGVTKQDGNTKELVHKTDELIVFISKIVTLLPGDVILTGTPCGVGVFRKPPEYLKKGDIVECEIEKIGTIINKIV